ncbi:hypothetical protein [Oceanivirga salmonicida]|nr:hypothetical protein [Oceanivirga salmonicida]
MNILILFWKILIVLGLFWYIKTIIIVAIRGYKNIKEMLEAVSNEKN